MNRKTKFLAFLMVLWGGIILYQANTREEPKRVPLTYTQGQKVSGPVQVSRDRALSVHLNLLEGHSGITLETPKNLFAPLQVYLPPPPPPATTPTTTLPPLPPPPPPPTPEELAMEQARLDLSQFRYLGYLNKGPGQEQAFLARGPELFIVGKGQLVWGTIFLKELTSGYAILRENNTQLEITLTTSGG